ncbi:MAG: TetR/AcrR family transcriptional regulator [Candidatus Acidiferrales bacterium]
MANAKARGQTSAPIRGTRRSTGRAQHTGKRTALRTNAAGAEVEPGLRERKKARLRQDIIDTALRLFRARGYEDTRVEDIVQVLEISQPTFFRYFPTKDAVLCEVGRRGFSCITEKLKSELTSDASTADRLRRLYQEFAHEAESNRWLWRAVVLSGAMDPVRSPQMRGQEKIAASLLQEILEQGQKRGEITRDFPVGHMAEFMEALYNTVVRNWVVDLPGPDKLMGRVRNAVEFFLRGVEA